MSSSPSSPTLGYSDENSSLPSQPRPLVTALDQNAKPLPPRPVSKPWTQDEDLALLTASKSQFENDTALTEVLMWQAVSATLANMGVLRSGHSCSARFVKFKSKNHFLHAEWKDLQNSVYRDDQVLESGEVDAEMESKSNARAAAVDDEDEDEIEAVLQPVKWTDTELKLFLKIIERREPITMQDWNVVAKEHNSHGHKRTSVALKRKWTCEQTKLRNHNNHSTKAPSATVSQTKKKISDHHHRKRGFGPTQIRVDDDDEQDHRPLKRRSVPAIECKPKHRLSSNRGGASNIINLDNDDDDNDDLDESISGTARVQKPNSVKQAPKVSVAEPAQMSMEQGAFHEKLKRTRRQIVDKEVEEKIAREALRRHDFEHDLLRTRLNNMQREMDDLHHERLQKEAKVTQVAMAVKALQKEEASLRKSVGHVRR